MKWYTLQERFPKYNEEGIFYLKRIVTQWKEYPRFGQGTVRHDSTHNLWILKMYGSDYALDVKFIDYWLPFDELKETLPKKNKKSKLE